MKNFLLFLALILNFAYSQQNSLQNKISDTTIKKISLQFNLLSYLEQNDSLPDGWDFDKFISPFEKISTLRKNGKVIKAEIYNCNSGCRITYIFLKKGIKIKTRRKTEWARNNPFYFPVTK